MIKKFPSHKKKENKVLCYTESITFKKKLDLLADFLLVSIAKFKC